MTQPSSNNPRPRPKEGWGLFEVVAVVGTFAPLFAAAGIAGTQSLGWFLRIVGCLGCMALTVVVANAMGLLGRRDT